MPVKLIAYDLNAPGGDDYSELYDAIKGLGPWWHHLRSVWLVRTSMHPQDIRNRIQIFLDPSDDLLVIDVTQDHWATRGFGARSSAWLAEPWA